MAIACESVAVRRGQPALSGRAVAVTPCDDIEFDPPDQSSSSQTIIVLSWC